VSDENPRRVITIVVVPAQRYRKALMLERLITEFLQQDRKVSLTNEGADYSAPRRIELIRSRRDGT
jgi:hypothetical protein